MHKISEIMDLLAVHLGKELKYTGKFPVIRKEQSGKKPGYPYAAYKKISENSPGFLYRNEKLNSSPAKITEEHSRIISTTVSLSFYNSENKPDALKTIQAIADYAVNWLSVIGKADISAKGAVIQLLDFSVQDRTVYIDPVYEYQLGFDFILKETRSVETELDAVDIDGTMSRVNYNYE
ncbi:MAG TPA: hypothetical protein PKV80_24575 [Leptospiraceae bacterium]|nr:hypothetical protein [Leptospiraceae bacterium]